jgi:hypothetical protein
MKIKRAKLTYWILAPIFIVLFFFTNMRLARTCYERIPDYFAREAIRNISTNTYFVIFYIFKLSSTVILALCFGMMRQNKYFISQKFFWLYLASYITMSIVIIANIILLLTEGIHARNISFVAQFYLDFGYLLCLTFTVLNFR